MARAPSKEPTSVARAVSIGEASRRSGFSIKALRFYERRGLLPASARTPAGYRVYTEANLHRLEFIREAKALGLSLGEIHELVEATRTHSCTMTRPLLLAVLDQRLLETSRQIETLTRLRDKLRRSRRALARRAPTDHRLGYCSCLGNGSPLITAIRRQEGRIGDRGVEPEGLATAASMAAEGQRVISS